jgi:Zn-dependent peptidase ImmA (M78 family)
LSKDISDGRFWAKSECCQIFRRKGYFSKDRSSEIIFDVSIEIRLPDQQTFSILVLVECKDYSSPVPVDDIEEFWAKIQQVAGANVKGMLASTNAFQSGTIAFAHSKGIALLRAIDKDALKYELTRSTSTLTIKKDALLGHLAQKALSQSSIKSSYFDFCGFYDSSYSCSPSFIFERLCLASDCGLSGDDIPRIINPNKEIRRTVGYRHKTDIENIADDVLTSIGYVKGPVDLDSVCSLQHDSAGLTVRHCHKNPYDDSVLGTLSFDPFEIQIFYTDERNPHRERFTLSHELGHVFLDHRRYIVRERTEEEDFTPDFLASLPIEDIARLEWQANYFASCLLLPTQAFLKEFFRAAQEFDVRDRGFGVIYLDDQAVNQQVYYMLTNRLMNIFNASRQAIKYRLTALGYLNETRNVRHIIQVTRSLFR